MSFGFRFRIVLSSSGFRFSIRASSFLSGFTELCCAVLCRFMRGFPKTRGTLFGGPYNKDPTIWVTILGSPIFGNPHMCLCM